MGTPGWEGNGLFPFGGVGVPTITESCNNGEADPDLSQEEEMIVKIPSTNIIRNR